LENAFSCLNKWYLGSGSTSFDGQHGGSKRGCIKKNLRGRGVGIIPLRNLIFNVSIVGRMDMRQRHAKSLGKRSKTSKIRKKT
jgi:hypothetical protein